MPVDIVIGRIPPMDRRGSERRNEGPIETRILDVRPPRRRRREGGGRERRGRSRRGGRVDPAGSRVLVLLVPDGNALPKDLKDGGYRVLLHLLKR